ncbi:hypothetical protein AXG93_3810s1220 [Marchantia polymorpha subsp. ruderalis]|uniref:Uncharacterized protein n=1 Tax=Marchantia polymorpha subsp. ruderalis TaxID=1480154 RepID=A0A176VEA6_MARPO|nr:hypothetical protein AXG93_3810s1220 [Marchantia polymorpha subsp. ruderalis]
MEGGREMAEKKQSHGTFPQSLNLCECLPYLDEMAEERAAAADLLADQCSCQLPCFFSGAVSGDKSLFLWLWAEPFQWRPLFMKSSAAATTTTIYKRGLVQAAVLYATRAPYSPAAKGNNSSTARSANEWRQGEQRPEALAQ